MRTEFMGYLKGKTVAEMVHGFMDVNKHCNNTSEEMSKSRSKVSKCVQNLIIFSNMLVSFQPSKNHHHTVRILFTIVGSHPFLNLPLEKKRCPVLKKRQLPKCNAGSKMPNWCSASANLWRRDWSDRDTSFWCWHCCFLKLFRFSDW